MSDLNTNILTSFSTPFWLQFVRLTLQCSNQLDGCIIASRWTSWICIACDFFNLREKIPCPMSRGISSKSLALQGGGSWSGRSSTSRGRSCCSSTSRVRALGAPSAASFFAAESQVARGSLKVVGSPLCRSPCCNQSGDHDCDREYVMPDIHG